ncbi:hypothetical protein OpiT1DRAFT_01838 [Opitutaceae bacterium TAV1]|nr:hypothetical protein OpiT1DRAFT_01838 [Opitutaceae bacterium TAV1]
MNITRKLLPAFAVVLSVATLPAATLVTWDFEGSTNSAILESCTAIEGITASAVGTHNLNNVRRHVNVYY